MFNKYIPFGGLQLEIPCPGFPSWCTSTTKFRGFPLSLIFQKWLDLVLEGERHRLQERKKRWTKGKKSNFREKVKPSTANTTEIWEVWVKDCDQNLPPTRMLSPLTAPAAWIFDTIPQKPLCSFSPLPSPRIPADNSCPSEGKTRLTLLQVGTMQNRSATPSTREGLTQTGAFIFMPHIHFVTFMQKKGTK